MNREILFKAKRIDNGEWVYGGTIVQFLDDGIRSFYMPQFNENCDCVHDDLTDDILGFENCRFYKVDGNTICQYTGLTDKNGNKIWENDVVEVWWKQRTLEEDHKPKRYKAVVEFGNPNSLYSWGWQLRFQEDFPFNNDILLWIDMEEAGAFCEVICNIFDNPELLEGGVRDE